MAYFAPFIDAAGLHLPTYADIKAYEQTQFVSVYGQTNYVGNDNADIQWISIFSLMINDAFNTAQLAVNARSPLTAVGADLDSIVKINAIARKPATASTAILTIGGTPGTIVNLGVAQDQNGNLWNLPTTFTIPNSGTIALTAVSQVPGAITALAGTITIISSPITQGWSSVTNLTDAFVGQAIEADSALRARQSISVSLVSKTLVAGTIAAIAALPNVTRYNPGTLTPGGPGTSVENPTGAVDSWGNPAHSISMVVEGGADLDIATAIYNNKSPGCFLNGTTTVAVTDPTSLAIMDVSFFRPTYVPIYVTLNVHPLVNYSSAVTAAIKAAVNTYLNSLQIGESLTHSALYAVALQPIPNLLIPGYSVQSLLMGIAPSPSGTSDISINFNQVFQNNLANVIVNLV